MKEITKHHLFVSGEASNYFTIVNEGDNQGFITLSQMFEETREFEVNTFV